MATKLLDYSNVFGVAESSDLMATVAGHLYHLKATEDIENGSFTAIDPTTFVSGDVFQTKKPGKEDPVALILTSIVIYEDYTPVMQEERNFYNKKDDIVRAYQLQPTDRFALSKECFTSTKAPEKGKYIAMDGTQFKATVYDAAPTDTAFVGYIYDVAANGNYRIFVMKNAMDKTGGTE